MSVLHIDFGTLHSKTQETSNYRNTFGSLKRIIGRIISDPDLEIETKYLHATLVDVNGTVGAERRAIQDAAAIAGLNALRLINDTTATALSWGITTTDLPDPENPRNIMFVDVAHSSMSVSVVAFAKGQLVVKGSAYDRHLGGRDIDYALLQHFAKELKTKHKIDVMSNPKATFRLAVGCEPLKQVLSANTEAPLNVESIMNDVDASSKLSRDEYKQLIAPVLERISGPLEEALAESGLSVDQIDAVELIGGSTRIPAVRVCIQAALGGKPLSTTLNQGEAIARGATFACAFFGPTFRVREFHMRDISHYPIQVCWERSEADPDEDTELTVFPRGNSVPSTKVLTFYRKGPFDIEARYLEAEGLPGGINPWIATFSTKNVPADPRGDLTYVKLQNAAEPARHNVVRLCGRRARGDCADGRRRGGCTCRGAGEEEEGEEDRRPLHFPRDVLGSGYPGEVQGTGSTDARCRQTRPGHLGPQKRLGRICLRHPRQARRSLRPFVQPAEKTKLLGMLQEGEDWLYSEEGEDATKSAYVGKLDALKAVGDPIVARYREAEERPRAIAELRTTLNEYMSQATSSDDKFAHLDPRDKNAVVEKCATIQKWLEDQIARQAEQSKNQDGVLKPVDILKKKDEIIYFAIPILTKPKPIAVPPNGT
ncbi:heat shock protein [Melanogaster broomeanus]|nr:heat shock protein [Melanogaster broomeanus]